MGKLKRGIYDFMGNSVIYEYGGFGFDLDSRELIAVDMLEMLGEYEYTIEEYEQENSL